MAESSTATLRRQIGVALQPDITWHHIMTTDKRNPECIRWRVALDKYGDREIDVTLPSDTTLDQVVAAIKEKYEDLDMGSGVAD